MPVEPFDSSIHDREAFHCGVDVVDRYFQAVAQQAADRYVSQTYVLVPSAPRPERCEVIGYYTLVQHGYRDSEIDETTARALKVRKLSMIPMILLGQLGVATAHQHKGVGTALLRDALRRSLYVALTVGAVAVITDPIDERADVFYQKHGFTRLISNEPRLMIPTPVIARYNPDIRAAFKTKTPPVEINFGTQTFTS